MLGNVVVRSVLGSVVILGNEVDIVADVVDLLLAVVKSVVVEVVTSFTQKIRNFFT